MADKQEIKYKVRKTDGTDGTDGVISLNVIRYGGRYLLHRAFVAQSNKKRQGTASTKTRSEIRGGGKKPWKQKAQGMLDLDQVIHLCGMEEELLLDLDHVHMHIK